MNRNAAVFLDRDGTINEDVGYLADPDELIIYPGAAEAIRLLNRAGLKSIVVTNQSGIARGLLTESALAEIHQRLVEELAGQDAVLDGIYYCPHHPLIGSSAFTMDCECRKPGTALLDLAAREHDIDLKRSYVIGDKSSDMEMATAAGARGILVLTGYGSYTEARHRGPTATNLLEAVRLILAKDQ